MLPVYKQTMPFGRLPHRLHPIGVVSVSAGPLHDSDTPPGAGIVFLFHRLVERAGQIHLLTVFRFNHQPRHTGDVPFVQRTFLNRTVCLGKPEVDQPVG